MILSQGLCWDFGNFGTFGPLGLWDFRTLGLWGFGALRLCGFAALGLWDFGLGLWDFGYQSGGVGADWTCRGPLEVPSEVLQTVCVYAQV